MDHLKPGTKLQGGSYAVGRVLERGGSCILYRGEDTSLGRPVAIKEFFPPGSARWGLKVRASARRRDAFGRGRERFQAQAQALAGFNHRGIVGIFDRFEENGTAYTVLEFLPGQTLARRIELGGAMPEGEALEVMAQVGWALAEVHASGVTRRSISPHSVMLCPDGRAVLMGFGPAREDEDLGASGLGTSSDAHILCCTLYFLLTGQLPPKTQRAPRRSPGEPEALRLRQAGVSERVSEAVMVVLREEEWDSPRSAEKFLWSLGLPEPSLLLGGAFVPEPKLAQLWTESALVDFVAFSPDGRMLAHPAQRYALGGESVGVRDVATGQRRLVAARAKMNSAVFSPDGRTLIVGTVGGRVQLWDVRTNRRLRTLADPTALETAQNIGIVSVVAASPDGKRIASGGYDNTVRLWDAEDGSLLHTLRDHEGWINSLAFSPDGRLLASADQGALCDSRVYVWEVETGRRVDGLGAQGKAAAFSPNGRHLAVGSFEGLQMWEVSPVRRLYASGYASDSDFGPVNSVAFSPNGRMLAGGCHDQAVRIWDVATGRRLHILRGHEGSVQTVAFSPDGQWLASGGYDYTARLWSFPNLPQVLAPAAQPGPEPSQSRAKRWQFLARSKGRGPGERQQ